MFLCKEPKLLFRGAGALLWYSSYILRRPQNLAKSSTYFWLYVLQNFVAFSEYMNFTKSLSWAYFLLVYSAQDSDLAFLEMEKLSEIKPPLTKVQEAERLLTAKLHLFFRWDGSSGILIDHHSTNFHALEGFLIINVPQLGFLT